MKFSGRFIVNSAGATMMLLCIVLGASRVLADEIRIGTIAYPGIRITDINDDSLQYFINGQQRTAGLDRVSIVEINKYPQFGEAVKALESDPSLAVRLFRGVIGDVKEDYFKPMMQSYYITALERAGQFDQAVAQYLQLVKKYPRSHYADNVPTTLPKNADQLKRAADAITATLPDVSGDGHREALQKLLARITAVQQSATEVPAKAGPTAAGAPQTAPTEQTPAPVEPAEPEQNAPEASFISMTSIERLMAAKKYEEAVDQANKMMDRPRAPLPDLFYQRALAEVAMGQDDRAAMSFLRVAIHFPDHKLAIPALFQAGQSLARAGDPKDAANVYKTALTKATDAQTRQQIQRALDALPAESK